MFLNHSRGRQSLQRLCIGLDAECLIGAVFYYNLVLNNTSWLVASAKMVLRIIELPDLPQEERRRLVEEFTLPRICGPTTATRGDYGYFYYFYNSTYNGTS